MSRCRVDNPATVHFFSACYYELYKTDDALIITNMYELIKINENDYYVDCPAKVGIVKISPTDVVLIDSGSDKDGAKKVLKILEENNWTVKAIFNTHSHADHIGGNALIQQRTGCPVYAKDMECVYTNNPSLEAVGLYGGNPFKDLNNKFLLAQKSEAKPLTEDVLPTGMSILPLPGHSFDMVGFLTKDKTAYIADSISSVETLAKYKIGYQWNIQQVLETLSYLKTLQAKTFVPSHAACINDISELIAYNEKAIENVKNKIIELCSKPLTIEEIIQKIFQDWSMIMSAQQYVLIGSTVRSYISYLYDQGVLKYLCEDGKLVWLAS